MELTGPFLLPHAFSFDVTLHHSGITGKFCHLSLLTWSVCSILSPFPFDKFSTVKLKPVVLGGGFYGQTGCMLMSYLDSCGRRLFSLVAHDPGVGSWEVMHSKSGGRKTQK